MRYCWILFLLVIGYFNVTGQETSLIIEKENGPNPWSDLNINNQEDQFQILTHEFLGKNMRLINKDDAIARIEEIEITPKVKQINQFVSRQQQILSEQNDLVGIVYVISDFQSSLLNDNIEFDTMFQYNFIPIQSVQENNITIDSCWFSAPVHMINQNNQLYIKISNYGNQDAENIRLSLVNGGQEQPLGAINIASGTSITDTVNITPFETGWQTAQVKITDYPINFDDSYYFTYEVKDQINVLVINDGVINPYLQAAFQGISYFSTTNTSVNNIQYAEFPNYQLIIVHELANLSSGLAAELKEYIEAVK